MDGQKLHENSWGTAKGLVLPPDPDVFIGRCPGGIPFNGYIDDLTLWNRSLGQGEIRALSYLDRGLNAIVVPRGLFFNSQFFASMNDSSTFGPGNPLMGSMIMGNDNQRELNSRVVQQLIAANLTLAEAYDWIQRLCTDNATGNVTSFPLVVTSEVYTIGFDPALMNVLPNMTVENSGNHSVPPPPARKPSYWERVWNSFTGLVSSAWNALVAVCTFVANVALAVVEWGIGFAVAIASGQGLQYFYETVVKPFVELVLAFVRWIIDLVKSAIDHAVNAIWGPVSRAVNSWAMSVYSLSRQITQTLRGNQDLPPSLAHQFGEALFGPTFGILFVVAAVLATILIAVWLITLPVSCFISSLADLLMGFVIAALFSTALSIFAGSLTVDLTTEAIKATTLMLAPGDGDMDIRGYAADIFVIIIDSIAIYFIEKVIDKVKQPKLTRLLDFALALAGSLGVIVLLLWMVQNAANPQMIPLAMDVLSFVGLSIGILSFAVAYFLGQQAKLEFYTNFCRKAALVASGAAILLSIYFQLTL